MMKRRRLNENGLSLVEVLGTVAIFMIFITIFYQVLINVVDTIESRQEKEKARREANYILALLTNVHQTSEAYTIIKGEDGELIVQYIEQNEPKTVEVDTSPYEWELVLSTSLTNQLEFVNTKNPENKVVHVTLSLSKSGKRSDSLTFQTKISRLTEAKGE